MTETEEGRSHRRATGTLTLTGGFEVKKREEQQRDGGRGEIRWGRDDWFTLWLKRWDNAEITLIRKRQLQTREGKRIPREIGRTSLSTVTFAAHNNNGHLWQPSKGRGTDRRVGAFSKTHEHMSPKHTPKKKQKHERKKTPQAEGNPPVRVKHGEKRTTVWRGGGGHTTNRDKRKHTAEKCGFI